MSKSTSLSFPLRSFTGNNHAALGSHHHSGYFDNNAQNKNVSSPAGSPVQIGSPSPTTSSESGTYRTPLSSPLSFRDLTTSPASPESFTTPPPQSSSGRHVPLSPLYVPKKTNNNMYFSPRLSNKRNGNSRAQQTTYPGLKIHSLGGAKVVVWSGMLQDRPTSHPKFSKKAFLGGIPMNMNPSDIESMFKEIGPIDIEWPGSNAGEMPGFAGYVHIVFESMEKLQRLLEACELHSDGWYMHIHNPRLANPVKSVQVVPWDINHNYYNSKEFYVSGRKVNLKYSIFVGGIHGLATAKFLFTIMTALFGTVLETELETDKLGYPIGMGRVSFFDQQSYIEALKARFVIINSWDVKNNKFQIEPYLFPNEFCSSCKKNLGPFFCRDIGCLRYFCMFCFRSYHCLQFCMNDGDISSHQLMFRAKSRIQTQTSEAVLSSLTLEFRDYLRPTIGLWAEGEEDVIVSTTSESVVE